MNLCIQTRRDQLKVRLGRACWSNYILCDSNPTARFGFEGLTDHIVPQRLGC